MQYPSGTPLFAAPSDDLTISRAKEYIKEQGYTADEVKLVKCDGQILVIKK